MDEFFDFESAVWPSEFLPDNDQLTLEDGPSLPEDNVQPITDCVNGSPWIQSELDSHLNDSFDTSMQWNSALAAISATPSPSALSSHDLYSAWLPDVNEAGLPYTPDQNVRTTMHANTQEIRGWFADSAKRDHRLKRGLPRRRSLYSRSLSQPILTQRQGGLDWAALNPLQRWQNSPPENEAASISAISDAVAATDLNQSPAIDSGCSSNVSTPGLDPQGFNLTSQRTSRPNSVSSIESVTSNGSLDSMKSSRSCGSRISTGSGSRRSGGRSNARITKTRNRNAPNTDERVFQCTFCCDTFKSRYDWVRHEKSLHLNLEQWICTPDGEVIICPMTGRSTCAYCLTIEPSSQHLETHNYRACADRSCDFKKFNRKDHLIQHLRLVHKVDIIPGTGHWRAPESLIKSRCGFCGFVMDDWKSRADHLSKHFRDGRKMTEWHGDHGFEPEIAGQVMNSMPPYLIGSESKTLIPFSATKPGHQEHLAQMSSRVPPTVMTSSNDAVGLGSSLAMSGRHDPPKNLELKTCWDFLSFHLGRFAQERLKAGVIPTDEEFQEESRRIWYDSDDPWNQTVADSSEWLESFRRENGLPGGNVSNAA